MADALLGFVLSAVEVVLYLVIIAWVFGIIGALIRKPFSVGGQKKGSGIGGQLVVAGIIGTVRLIGRAINALASGLFRHVAPAIYRSFTRLAERTAARSRRDHDDEGRPKRQRRRRLPRISFEWPSQRRTPARRTHAGTFDYPADEFSDEWRRAAGDDL